MTIVSASEMSETTTTNRKQNKDDAHQQKMESNQQVLNDVNVINR